MPCLLKSVLGENHYADSFRAGRIEEIRLTNHA